MLNVHGSSVVDGGFESDWVKAKTINRYLLLPLLACSIKEQEQRLVGLESG